MLYLLIILRALKMDQGEVDSPHKTPSSDNADLVYILDLFDSKELGLTITEDNE